MQRSEMHLAQIENKVQAALRTVRKICDSQLARPALASQVQHEYEDKYALTEQISTMAVASWLHVLEALGLDHEKLIELTSASRAGQRVLLRISSEETCKLSRTAKKEVASDKKVQSTSTIFGKHETQVVHTVHEYVWGIDHRYTITASTKTLNLTLLHRETSCEVTTHAERAPLPEHHAPTHTEADIT